MITRGTPIEVLYQDESLVVVNKPGGVLVHRTREAAHDNIFLIQELRNQLGFHVFPVHRLDRAASGALAFGCSSAAARALQAALGAPKTVKRYLVLCRGLTPERWEVDRPLSNAERGTQDARTEFETVAHFANMSLVRARLWTGRRHQIRRHLAHSAHQVIGDTTYGKGRINRSLREQYGLPRMFLHAQELSFPHPEHGDRLQIHAPLPKDLHEFLLRLPEVQSIDLSSALTLRAPTGDDGITGHSC